VQAPEVHESVSDGSATGAIRQYARTEGGESFSSGAAVSRGT